MTVVGALVIARIVLFAATAFLVSDSPAFQAAQTVDGLFAALIDIVVLFLVLLLFDAIRRIERESDRMQSFMDNMYRRLP